MVRAIPGLCVLLVASAALGQSVRDEESEQHFRKWLDEDARYIINPEEKTVFQEFSTSEEKERFIEQFWLRRDPDPLEPFATLSGLKVYPNLQKNTFPAGERVGLYFEIYNFSVDSATGEADLKIPLRVLDREGRVVQEIRLDHVGLTYLGERAWASTHLYIDGVGDFRAEISIENLISEQKKGMSVRFRIQDYSG